MSATKKPWLQIRESNLEYLDTAGILRWSLPISCIVLVAEYTTNEGPYADDYFLVFVTVEDGKLYFSTCSVYSGGAEEVLSSVQQHLGSPIQLELQGSTEWRSRVAWPVNMAGTEYFSFTELPAVTLSEKVKNKILGPTHEYAISKAVHEYLEDRLSQ